MRYDGGCFARIRDAWLLRRILDTRGAVDAGAAGAAGAERDAADAGSPDVKRSAPDCDSPDKRRRERSADSLDTVMVEALRAGGTSLPPSKDAPLYREYLLAAVEKARSGLAEDTEGAGALRMLPGGVEAGRGEREGTAAPARDETAEPALAAAEKTAAPRRRVFTLPRVAAACLVILALLVGMGFASTYAMPGNPLYSVKRTMERARLLLTQGGEGEANLLIDSACRRLDELEYAGEREMTFWYASLAMDAVRDILKALGEGRDLPEEEAAASVRSRALEALKRLESLLLATLADIPRQESEELQHEFEDIREELWPEGIPPEWVDPWADQEAPAEPATPAPPIGPVPPVIPDEQAPPVEPPVVPSPARGRIFVFRFY